MQIHEIFEQVGFMTWQYGGLALGRWSAFILVSLAVFVAARIVRRVLISRVERLAGTTTTRIDKLLLDVIRATRLTFLLLISLYAGALTLPLSQRIEGLLQTAVTIAFLVQAGLWGGRVVVFAIEESVRRRGGENGGLKMAAGALGFLARLGLWTAVLLMVLASLKIDVTALIAGLGIGGVAVALATQNILGDLFASLSIVLDRPFEVGDFIIVEDVLVTVEHVGVKTTRIRSLSGEQVIIANGDLLKSRIRNYKRLRERRVLFGFGVVYGTPYEKLSKAAGIVREIIKSIEKTRFDRAHFKQFGESSLDFEVVYYVLDGDYNLYMDIQQKINLTMLQRFSEEGIEFAFPTRTLYVNEMRGREAGA